MAQVSQVGVFSGGLNDNFESYPLGATGPVFSFLGGVAVNTSTDFADIWISNSHGLGDSKGSLFASKMMVANDDPGSDWNITFSTPMERLGGYWQSAYDDSTLTFQFFDGSLAPLNTITITPPNINSLVWYGFECTGGIGKVRVTSSRPFQAVDDFTADVVPEPATAAILGLGALVLLHKRRGNFLAAP